MRRCFGWGDFKGVLLFDVDIYVGLGFWYFRYIDGFVIVQVVELENSVIVFCFVLNF